MWGVNGRGKEHIQGWGKLKDARITTICDVNRNLTGGPAKAVAARYGSVPKIEQDIRRVLDHKDIDVISIATPNQWHALMTIWACQAGKDVYLEKPVSHDVTEGRRMVEAARHYKKIVETGTQYRSLNKSELPKTVMAPGSRYVPFGSVL